MGFIILYLCGRSKNLQKGIQTIPILDTRYSVLDTRYFCLLRAAFTHPHRDPASLTLTFTRQITYHALPYADQNKYVSLTTLPSRSVTVVRVPILSSVMVVVCPVEGSVALTLGWLSPGAGLFSTDVTVPSAAVVVTVLDPSAFPWDVTVTPVSGSYEDALGRGRPGAGGTGAAGAGGIIAAAG